MLKIFINAKCQKEMRPQQASRFRKIQFPKRNFNPNGFLIQNIFRLCEYPWNNNVMLNDPIEMKRKAFLLRKNLDGCFNDTENRVIPQPKRISGFYVVPALSVRHINSWGNPSCIHFKCHMCRICMIPILLLK
mmetsp:Transcript_2856/g.4014  ORF Transcript_2856/g.4014 Transcript_2856/m.4014 type:complete len:133 (+) Transcript_2856:1140-1538(+)